MIVYVDENVPQKIATRLRAEGYQVEYVTRRVEDQEKLREAFTILTESAVDIRRPLR